MVNKVAKGKRAERELAKLLEGMGYATWRPAWHRYGSKDVFNIADIVAVRKKGSTAEPFGSTPFPLFLIQVKTNRSDFYKARKQMREFVKGVEGNINVSVALKIRGSKYRLFITDGREEQEFMYDFKKREKFPINKR